LCLTYFTGIHTDRNSKKGVSVFFHELYFFRFLYQVESACPPCKGLFCGSGCKQPHLQRSSIFRSFALRWSSVHGMVGENPTTSRRGSTSAKTEKNTSLRQKNDKNQVKQLIAVSDKIKDYLLVDNPFLFVRKK